MADDDQQNGNGSGGQHGGSNGDGSLAVKVAGRLMGTIARLDQIGRQFSVIDQRLEGLARVLLRGVPFDEERAGQVATVIGEAATLAHQYGEELYMTAEDMRAAGKTGG